MMIVALVLLGLISQGLSFQCDVIFSKKTCDRFDIATDSLNNIVKTVEESVSNGMVDIADETASFYKSLMPLLNKANWEGKLNVTMEKFQEIFQNFLGQLKKLSTIDGISGLKQLANKLKNILTNALDTKSVAYSTDALVAEHFEKAKASIKNALKDVNTFVRHAIMLVINRFHGHVKDFTAVVDSTLEKFGMQIKHWDVIKESIDKILATLKDKIQVTTMNNTANATKKAEEALMMMFDDMSQQKGIVKRGINDIWDKVKAAVSNLSGKIKETTMKVIEEYKPKIIEALENVKKIAIEGAKKLFIEVNGEIVKVVIDSLTVESL